MDLEINWGMLIGLLIIFGLVMLAVLSNAKGHINEETGIEIPCLIYSDGKLAVLLNHCGGLYESMTWFLERGYHIDSITDPFLDSGTVVMTR